VKTFDVELEGNTRLLRIGVGLIALTVGAYFLSSHNYLLFHSATELFSIVVAFGIFVVAWNSRTFHENDYLIFIGIAYLFVAGMDLIHTLAYEGMGVFPNYGADLPTQLWIISRYMESLSLLVAPVFFYRKLNYKLALIGYSSTSLILLLTVFYWKVFPRCFIPGSGLTPFKVTSEYVISAILVGAILLLVYNRDEFDKEVFYFLIAALCLTVFSELLFTFYINVYGISNLLGHLFKIGSFYLIYIALIDTGFKQPYRLLFKRLKDSERKYQQYFEELGDALFITKIGGDDHGRILDVNDRAAEQTGYDKEKLIGMNIEEDLVVEPPTMGHEEGDERLAQGEMINFTEKKVSKDGSEYWTEVVVTPIDYEGQKASLSINRDITKRKKAEERLKESEKQLRKSEKRYKQLAEELEVILDHIPGLVFYKDTENNFIKVNKRLAEAHDMSKEELEGKSVFDLYPKEEAERYWEDDKEVINSKEPILHRVEPWTPEEKRWMSTSKIPYIVDGEVKGVIGVSIDITERKEAERKLKKSEERLELALEGTNTGLWDWNVQTGEVVFNERWARIVGYTLGEFQPISIETWRNLTHPEDLNRSNELLEKHFNGETDLYECEARMKHKNGDWVWVLDRGRVVEWGEEGEPIRMVGTHQDITERKETEKELQEEREELRKLHSAVDQFQQCQTETDLCDTATAATEGILGFDWCAFYCREGDQLVPRAATEDVDLEELPTHHITEGLAGATYRRGETLAGEDFRKDDRATISEDTELRSYMSVPIGEVGVFQAASRRKGAFNQTDLELAEILAGHLHEEVKRIRLEEELRHQAIRDPLTGIYNRRYFNETLKKEIEKSERYSRPIAFLMIDVNRFKEINDRYSHQTGDRVLKEVAQLLKQNVRKADLVTRYGGDEFLIMLPETNGEASHTVARLREKLEEWNRSSDLLDFPLTLAIGSAHWSPEERKDPEQVLKEADKKMYKDKER